MPRDEGIDTRVQKQAQPQPQRGRGYGMPAWIKPQVKKQKDDVAANEPTPQPSPQPTRYNPTGAQTPAFTPPAWWNNLSNRVGNWIDNNVSGSQYVPAGLSQPQRPTTAAQFTRPAWIGNNQNQMQVSEPSNPSLPTGTFFAGGSTQDGTRLVPTGQNTSALLGGGGIRNRGTVRIAKGSPMIGAPSQPSTVSNGGGGTTYKKKKGGGYGGGYGGYSYDPKAYADRAPSWLMNLTNWNFKG